MALSTTSAATLALSSTSGRRVPINYLSSSPSSLASSSSLFLTDTNRAGLELAFKAQTSIKYNNNEKNRGMSCNCLFGLGVPELAVIVGVAALVFGPKQLPEVGRSFGKTIKSFQQAAKEFESELKKEPEEAEASEKAVVAVTDGEKKNSEEKQDVSI